jgi:hypothetical protein
LLLDGYYRTPLTLSQLMVPPWNVWVQLVPALLQVCPLVG